MTSHQEQKHLERELLPVPILWIVIVLMLCVVSLKEHANKPKEHTETLRPN